MTDLELGGLSRHQLDKLAAAEIRKVSRSPSNRLLSIEADADVVRRVAEHWPHLALVANLRCGAWYTPPSLTSATSYFKSTDGHTNQWSFSLKRNNLHLLPLVEQRGGIIIADSTRRGKKLPDALSKTIPIWCAVLNAAISKHYGLGWNDAHGAGLHTPSGTVSASEHAQIEILIDKWADLLLQSDLQVPRLDRPLRPIFVTTNIFGSLPDLTQLPFHHVVCLSVSRQTKGGMAYAHSAGRSGRTYVYMQGAGDDHENWAMGLTPAVWWDASNHEDLLQADDDSLEPLIASLVAQNRANEWFVPTLAETDAERRVSDVPGMIEGTLTGSCLTLCRGGSLVQDLQRHPSAGLVIRVDDDDNDRQLGLEEGMNALTTTDTTSNQHHEHHQGRDQDKAGSRVLRLSLPSGKRSLPKFNAALRKVIAHVEQGLVTGQIDLFTGQGIVVSSSQPGSTHAAGAIYVALLAMLLDDRRVPVASSRKHGDLSSTQDTQETDLATRARNDDADNTSNGDSDSEADPVIDALAEHASTLTKDSVRRRLQWLLSDPGLHHVVGSAGPARAWLNRVNEVLISSQL